MSARLKQIAPILALVGLFLSLAIAHSAIVPLSKAPDEYVHFLYSRFVVEHGRLPITWDERQGAGYKSDQPPLYYGLMALATRWIEIDTGPTLKMTWDSPRRRLADILLPRGMIVWTEDETPPYRGIVLAWFVGRWLSGLLSATTVVLVYAIALEIFPTQRHLALGAAATLAFIPAYLFISGVLNDDNLTGLLMALFFLLLVRLAQNHRAVWLFVGLGVLMGLAMTTKYSTLLLPVETVLALGLIGRRWRWRRAEWLRVLSLCFVGAIAVSSWWFIFVGWHFNEIDELGWFLGLLKPIFAGDASDPAAGILIGDSTAGAREPFYIWVSTFFIRFWEVPVAGRSPLYPPIITSLVMLFLCGAAMYGLGHIWRQNKAQDRFWLQLLTLHVLTFLVLPLVRYLVSGKVHDTAQARHLLFPAAPAFAILLVWGLSQGFIKRQWRGKYYLFPLVLIVLSLAQLYHYSLAFPPRLPVRTAVELADPPTYPLNQTYPDGFALIGYDQQLTTDPPTLELVLHWRSLVPAHEDYLTEISLLDQQGQVAAQTVAHPVQGRYPTRAWDPADILRDTLVLPLNGVPGGRYDLQLRLLGWDTPLVINDSERLILTTVNIPGPQQGFQFVSATTGSPTLNFDIWQKGQPTTHPPTYRYLADIPITFGPFPAEAELRANLVGPDGQLRSAGTEVGQLRTFIVDYDWPSGPYALQAELWQQDTRLQESRSEAVLWVENRPIPFAVPSIGQLVQANFDDKLMLLGYDLPMGRIVRDDEVSLLLYWQALDRMRESYVMFVRLLDQNQQVWGTNDRLPQEIYSTILWVPDEVVTDGFILKVDPNAPNGVYQVVLGLYREDDQQARSLQLIQDGLPSDMSSISLGSVKIGGPPAGATVTTFKPEVDRKDAFGQTPLISLRGYDLEQGDEHLTLTLYWRSEALTDTNYTRFVHLRNAAGKTVAQNDAPPGNSVYLSSLWEPGEVIADTLLLPLSENLAPTTYTLAVGLYDPTTGQRLPVQNSPAEDNSLSLTTVELK